MAGGEANAGPAGPPAVEDRGFVIRRLRIRDMVSGETKWEEKDWKPEELAKGIEAHLPASILGCEAVGREVEFSSREMLTNLRLVQEVAVGGQKIEEWRFDFGFVIPGSTNTMEHAIIRSEDGALPVELLSGNTVVTSTFFDGEQAIARSCVTLFYDVKEGTPKEE